MKINLRNSWQFFEKYPRSCALFSGLFLGVICWLVFVWNLGSTGLVDETEPLFVEAAREMVVSGDWITPYFNGETRFDKPPLIYWLMAIAYQLIGTNEWAARLPSALGAIVLTVFGFFTLRYFGFPNPQTATLSLVKDLGERTSLELKTKANTTRALWLSAWIGSALIACNFQTIIWARTAVSDMLLSGCIGAAMFCFFWGYAKGEKLEKPGLFLIPNPWYIGTYICLSLAVLTKGPVGLVIPGLTFVFFLFYVGKLKEVLAEMGLIFGAGLFSILTVPWYVLVILRNGQAYIDSFFGYHNLERFTQVVNRHSAPIYFYFIVIFLGFLPWSFYLPVAIARLRFWRRSFWQKQPRQTHLGLFALTWFGVIFLFFTIAVTKLPSYTIPLLPAAALLVGLFWSDELTKEDQGQTKYGLTVWITGIVNVILLLIVSGVLFNSPSLFGDDPHAPNLPKILDASLIPEISGIVWLGTAIAILIFLIPRPRLLGVLIANFIGFMGFFSFAVTPGSFLADRQRQLPLRELARTAARVQHPGEELIMIGFKKPSIVFYSQKKVDFFSHTPYALQYFWKTASQRPANASILILCLPSKLAETNLQPGDYQEVEKSGPYILIRVPQKTLLVRNAG